MFIYTKGGLTSKSVYNVLYIFHMRTGYMRSQLCGKHAWPCISCNRNVFYIYLHMRVHHPFPPHNTQFQHISNVPLRCK